MAAAKAQLATHVADPDYTVVQAVALAYEHSAIVFVKVRCRLLGGYVLQGWRVNVRDGRGSLTMTTPFPDETVLAGRKAIVDHLKAMANYGVGKPKKKPDLRGRFVHEDQDPVKFHTAAEYAAAHPDRKIRFQPGAMTAVVGGLTGKGTVAARLPRPTKPGVRYAVVINGIEGTVYVWRSGSWRQIGPAILVDLKSLPPAEDEQGPAAAKVEDAKEAAHE